MATPLLEVQSLRVEARSEHDRILAVSDVDLTLGRGEVVGLIGESGSGKTTFVRSVIGLHERNVEIVGGRILLDGDVVYDHDAGIRRHRTIRGSRVGMVFQQPRRSLNPLKRIGSQLREVITLHRPELDKQQVQEHAASVLQRMALDPDRVMASYPHQLSGGMCQRAAVAIAVAPGPDVLIADEATSALDVTSQASLVGLLRELVETVGLSMLFVTHDVLLAAELCDRVVVLRSGVAVESGVTSEVLSAPRHPYTQSLTAAVPRWHVPTAVATREETA